MTCASMLTLLFIPFAFFFVFPWHSKPPLAERNIYCVQNKEGSWQLASRVRPLINRRTGTTLAKLSYQSNMLRGVVLSVFHTSFEIDTDYSFNPKGELTGMNGAIERWGRWYATTDLSVDAQYATPHHVQFFSLKNNNEIGEPEDCGRCRSELQSMKVYRNTAELPFANLLPEAEKLNATQK